MITMSGTLLLIEGGSFVVCRAIYEDSLLRAPQNAEGAFISQEPFQRKGAKAQSQTPLFSFASLRLCVEIVLSVIPNNLFANE